MTDALEIAWAKIKSDWGADGTKSSKDWTSLSEVEIDELENQLKAIGKSAASKTIDRANPNTAAEELLRAAERVNIRTDIISERFRRRVYSL